MLVRTTCVPSAARTTSGALARDRLIGSGTEAQLRSPMAICLGWTCLACMLLSCALSEVMSDACTMPKLLTAAVDCMQRRAIEHDVNCYRLCRMHGIAWLWNALRISC